MSTLLPFLHRVAARENLSAEDASAAMLTILNGEASTVQIAAFLAALRTKGESAEELLGFARAMRAKATPVLADLDGEVLVDTCGTGGDARGTFNISTIAAFVIAGAGVRVAKHGNRSISSQCGSADILEALGVRIDLEAQDIARSIREVGIGFLFAPSLHPAMKYAQPARLEMKMRTVFNLLGPLTNPAGARHQLIGAPSVSAAELMAQALTGLGTERAFVVHASDGLDEVTTTGPTTVFEITRGTVQRQAWTPDDFGVAATVIEDLRGGDLTLNCEIARRVLSGEPGPRRDIVLVNAAAALVAGERAHTLQEGMCSAAHSIDSGAAHQKLDQLVAFTQSL